MQNEFLYKWKVNQIMSRYFGTNDVFIDLNSSINDLNLIKVENIKLDLSILHPSVFHENGIDWIKEMNQNQTKVDIKNLNYFYKIDK